MGEIPQVPEVPEPRVDPYRAPIVCATCGVRPPDADVARLTWTMGTENGRTVWTCAACARRHIRAIEGKLDPSWW